MLCCIVKFLIEFVSKKSSESNDVITAVLRKIKVLWDVKSSWTARRMLGNVSKYSSLPVNIASCARRLEYSRQVVL